MAEEEKPKVNGAASPIVVKLRKSVIANGDDVMELSFREPTAADIERAGGNPVEIVEGSQGRIVFNVSAMTQMMVLLAAVPPSTIRQMHPKDWQNIAWSLAHFFTPDL